MTNEENRAIARELWDAIAASDVDGLQRLMSEKCDWQVRGNSALAGQFVGIDEILTFMATVGERTDELRSTLIDVFTNETGAVLEYSIDAHRGGERLHTRQYFNARIEAGLVTSAVLIPENQQEYDRFFA
jgi:ketosteroid isomerase-like protein